MALDIITDRYLPALSATSDMPEVAPPVAVVEETPVVETVEVAAPEVEAPVVETAPEAEPVVETPAKPKPPTLAEQRAAETARADRLAALAEQQADRLETALKTIEQLSPKPVEAQSDPRPERAKFDDPDAYDAALEKWGIRAGERLAEARISEETKAAAAEADRKAQDKAVADQVADLQTRWQAASEKSKTAHPDFEEAIANDDLQISMPMTHAIVNAGDIGPEIAYYLAKNPGESAEIAKLNPVAAVFALGQIAQRLVTPPPPPKITSAPPPPEPVRTRASSAPAKTIYDPNISMDEYAALRRQQRAASGRSMH